MPRPARTSIAQLKARADANNYKRGAHREKDKVITKYKHGAGTKQHHNNTLTRYVRWHLLEAIEICAQNKLSPPEEEDVRNQWLQRGVAAPDLATLKDFMRFYIATTTPQIDDVPTVDSINCAAEWFFASFSSVTETEIESEVRSAIYNWVRRDLVLEGLVVNKRHEKFNFGNKDLTRILTTLWTIDDLIFIPERYRIQTTFILNVYSWTGARVRAFFTGGLRYRDAELVLQRIGEDHEWRIIYRLDQRWVKNNKDPENIVFGAAAMEDPLLLNNDGGFLLLMALADGVIAGCHSFEDVYNQIIPRGKDEKVLTWKDSALDRPILRRCTKSGGVSDEPMPTSAFTDIFKSTLINTGYFCRASIHAIRRQVGKEIDKRNTAVERSQHLTQADPRVFGQSYVANCSSVDGQAAFRGKERDSRHIEYFQSVEKFHEEGIPTQLPSRVEEDLHWHPALYDLREEIRVLAQRTGDDKAVQALRCSKANFSNELKKLKTKTLRQHQMQWVKERREWSVRTYGRESAPATRRNELSQSIYQLIPERRRLAERMAANRPLKPHEMRSALEDLHSLCVQDLTVMYLPGTRPVDGACPVKCCKLPMERLKKDERNQHIQICVRRDMAVQLSCLESEIHYCHHCYDWVVNEIWEAHCEAHLTKLNVMRCGTLTYCHTLVRPGYCPFCMGDTTLPASKRLRSWTREFKLWSHVNKHCEDHRWPMTCPHPLCDMSLPDIASFQFHLIDDHDFGRARPGRRPNWLEMDVQKEERPLDEDAQDSNLSRTASILTGAEDLEQMVIHDIAPAALEISSLSNLPATSHLSPSTTCLEDLFPENFSDKETGSSPWERFRLPSLSSFEDGNQEKIYFDFESDSFSPQNPPTDTKVELAEHENIDDIILFDQFLRSPSPTTVPTSRGTFRGSESNIDLPQPFEEPPSEDTIEVVRRRNHTDSPKLGSRIRLRVSKPKITLRLRLRTASPSRDREKVLERKQRKKRLRSKV